VTDERRLDAHVRRLSRVSDEQVARRAGTAGREALLEGILTMPDPLAPAPRRRRVLRPLVLGAGVVAFAGTAAFGWALTRSDPHQTTAVQCEVPDSPSIIPSTSGDPVTDCAAEWQRQTGTAPPPLAAYDNGHGGIVVMPASDPAPRGATALPAGPAQDVAIIELTESLDDYVAGLPSGCFDTAAATGIANAALTRLGLTGWTVAPPAEGADARATCASFSVVDPAARTVSLRTTPNAPEGHEPFRVLAARLRDIASDCLPLAEASRRVGAAARRLGLDPGANEYHLAQVPAVRRCTTIHETVGGTIFLTLRGPA
jgi:hypothetical protein